MSNKPQHITYNILQENHSIKTTLETFLNEIPGLSWEQFLQLLYQIYCSIYQLHQLRLFHLNISLEAFNVKMDQGRPIVQLNKKELTKSLIQNAVVPIDPHSGNETFLPPEFLCQDYFQYFGKTWITSKVDVFALGILSWILFAAKNGRLEQKSPFVPVDKSRFIPRHKRRARYIWKDWNKQSSNQQWNTYCPKFDLVPLLMGAPIKNNWELFTRMFPVMSPKDLDQSPLVDLWVRCVAFNPELRPSIEEMLQTVEKLVAKRHVFVTCMVPPLDLQYLSMKPGFFRRFINASDFSWLRHDPLQLHQVEHLLQFFSQKIVPFTNVPISLDLYKERIQTWLKYLPGFVKRLYENNDRTIPVLDIIGELAAMYFPSNLLDLIEAEILRIKHTDFGSV